MGVRLFVRRGRGSVVRDDGAVRDGRRQRSVGRVFARWWFDLETWLDHHVGIPILLVLVLPNSGPHVRRHLLRRRRSRQLWSSDFAVVRRRGNDVDDAFSSLS